LSENRKKKRLLPNSNIGNGMVTFNLDGSEFIPLCDLMKIVDFTSSGAEAKHLIAEGKVKVDNEIELRKRCKIRSGQVVSFQGKEVKVI
jgi:ribosome-associated protein